MEAQSLNHWTTKEVPHKYFKALLNTFVLTNIPSAKSKKKTHLHQETLLLDEFLP